MTCKAFDKGKLNKGADVELYFNLNTGIKHYRANEYSAAIDRLSAEIQIDPTCSYAFLFRGLAHLRRREYEKGLADFVECIRLNPDCADAYFGHNLCRIELRQPGNHLWPDNFEYADQLLYAELMEKLQ